VVDGVVTGGVIVAGTRSVQPEQELAQNVDCCGYSNDDEDDL
jgi:hypothetical protein